MAQLPAKGKVNEIKAWFKAIGPNVAAVLPKHLTPERVIQVAVAAVTRNPLLLQCTKESLLHGVVLASQLGLEIGGPLRQAALVPFKNGRLTRELGHNVYDAVFMPEYRGLMDLSRNTGDVKGWHADLVYESEDFTWEVVDGKLKYTHKPDLSIDRESVEGALGAYASCIADGEVQGVWMPKAAIMKIKSTSRASSDGPWVDWETEMWKKCPIKRLSKMIPASPELRTALTADDRAESGQSIADLVKMDSLDIDGDGGEPEPEPSKVEKIKDVLAKKAPPVQEAETEPAETPSVQEEQAPSPKEEPTAPPASEPEKKAPPKKKAAKKKPEKKRLDPDGKEKLTREQASKIYELAGKNNWPREQIDELLHAKYGAKMATDLTQDQMVMVIRDIQDFGS